MGTRDWHPGHSGKDRAGISPASRAPQLRQSNHTDRRQRCVAPQNPHDVGPGFSPPMRATPAAMGGAAAGQATTPALHIYSVEQLHHHATTPTTHNPRSAPARPSPALGNMSNPHFVTPSSDSSRKPLRTRRCANWRRRTALSHTIVAIACINLNLPVRKRPLKISTYAAVAGQAKGAGEVCAALYARFRRLCP